MAGQDLHRSIASGLVFRRGRRNVRDCLSGPVLGGCFGVFQLLFASPVAVFLDEFAGFGELGLVAEEAGAVKVDVGEVERHRAALGDLLGLVEGCAGRRGIAADEVIQRGGEQTFGKLVESCPRRGGR